MGNSSTNLGFPLLERADLDLVKDWNLIKSKLLEFNSKQLLLNQGKEVHHAIMCRAKPKKELEAKAEQYYAGHLTPKKILHCYKLKL